ncbi:AraC-type DNA-binding protein [Nannocystis exedens]|uniref:AraC-type DNA-binding protein n=1 Tax=Nannocystis exedens TaxID=54 RepID=A0A1I1YFJ6_9BACT|nr:AraC family transcriptional regulator [Nannocystis exedens]PCC71936.1 AraC family transcriptional regulator [Nannocystis exedens]SFE16720.1 AraC-type DNA-binding protein [Nannocystis exedens]
MSISPRNRSVRPEFGVASDPLTDVLAAMHVRSALYFRLEATAPWGVRFAPVSQAKFAMVARGSCWLTVKGEPGPIALRAGDCFVVSDGSEFLLRDNLRSSTVLCRELAESMEAGIVRHGGGGAPTVVICGWFTFDAWSSAPLIDLLPRLLYVQTDDAQAAALQATLDLLATETSASAIGSPIVVSRLADILLVQTIRAYHASGASAAVGWLSAIKNPQIGAALRAMHRDVAHPWSVEALAGVAGMSRSAFSLRFKELVGTPPLEYLTRWRMYKVGCELRSGTASVADVAALVGYESVGALNRAFQRIHGVTPAAFRRAAAADSPTTRRSRRA